MYDMCFIMFEFKLTVYGILKCALTQPVAGAGTQGSSELAEGAECGGRVWIHHPLFHSDRSTVQPIRMEEQNQLVQQV